MQCGGKGKAGAIVDEGELIAALGEVEDVHLSPLPRPGLGIALEVGSLCCNPG